MHPSLARLVLALLATAGSGFALAGEIAGSAPALYVQYATLQSALESSPFGRPLHIDSAETESALQGDVHAVVDYSFAQVGNALLGGGRWCDILILHLNVKACKVAREAGDALEVYVGRKFDEPLAEAHKLDFAYRVIRQAPDYLEQSLTAESGPFGTRDYRIVVEAVPLGEDRTFLHLSYAYRYGFSAKVAMQTYLKTAGSRKVGFSSDGSAPDGRPLLVGGMRGALERNVMRYYLAIDAYLAALAAPPEERLEERLREWFDSTERYATQLHEVDEDAYLAMKRKECAAQVAE